MGWPVRREEGVFALRNRGGIGAQVSERISKEGCLHRSLKTKREKSGMLRWKAGDRKGGRKQKEGKNPHPGKLSEVL